jgi:hypothetical protein
MSLPETSDIVRDPSENIKEVDLREYAKNKLAVSDEEIETDTIMMNRAQGAIGFYINPGDKDAANVPSDYRRALVQSNYEVPPMSYQGKKTIWVFGNKLNPAQGITEKKLNDLFEADFTPALNKAIKQGVVSFNVLDKGFLSDKVREHLKSKGFVEEQHEGWLQINQTIEGSMGPLPVNPEEMEMIRKGRKTSVWSEEPIPQGKYVLDDGTVVRVTSNIKVEKLLKGKGTAPAKGSMAALGLDISEELKAVGYGSRAKVSKRYGKFVEKFVDNEGPITIVRLEIPTEELDKSKALKIANEMLTARYKEIDSLLKREMEIQEAILDKEEATGKKLPQDSDEKTAYKTVNSLREALQNEGPISYGENSFVIGNGEVSAKFSSYEDLFNKYDNKEIIPDLVPQAKDMLIRMNLVNYLSDVQPEDTVINEPAPIFDVQDPAQVIRNKSFVSNEDVEDNIMSCITL